MNKARRNVERTRAVGVVVPVHNEEERLGAALRALEAALDCVASRGVALHVVIVLDACSDESEAIAELWRRGDRGPRNFGVTVVRCDVKNVGSARAMGCRVVLQEFADVGFEFVWIATTDADSRVPAEWLRRQVARHDRGADAWAGRVAVDDWPPHRRHVADLWQRLYDAERGPVHGASLGFNAAWYVAVGGFLPLATGEDRGLLGALRLRGAVIDHDSSARVSTSARRRARAPRGFAAALTRIESSLSEGAS